MRLHSFVDEVTVLSPSKVKKCRCLHSRNDQKLWSSGAALSLSSPKSLQNPAFYTVWKMFCLCGGVEHRVLKLSQLKRMTDPDRYIYYKTVSKSHNGSSTQLHVKNKVVPTVFAFPEAGDRCPFRILDLYRKWLILYLPTRKASL